jgi:predicted NBD/HSP70 family sugar kinase
VTTVSGDGVSSPAGQHTVRRHNLSLVLHAVRSAGRCTRAQVAQTTGLARATVSVLADQLLEAGLLDELDPDRTSPGRPASPLRVNPDGPGGLGVEVNVDYVAACAVGLDGQVRAQYVEPFESRVMAPRVTLRRAARLAVRTCREAGIPIVGAGLALPGLVDADGVLRRAPNLPRWNGFAAAEVLGTDLAASGLEMVVLAANEANLAAIAQAWYGNERLRDFVHVSGDVGVGGGIVVGGQLYSGLRGYAGEIGHVVVDPSGPPCGCGGSGCLEQMAGLAALVRDAGAVDMDDLVERARNRDPRALTALQAGGRWLGIALAASVNLFDLPDVVLGGVYAVLAPWLTDSLTSELHARVVSRELARVHVHVSTLGPYAAVRGAAGSVVSRVLSVPDSMVNV